MSRLIARLRDERGISLLTSLLVLSVLTIATTGTIAFTSASARTVTLERSTVSARQLAEAGLNNAIAVLEAAQNPTFPDLLPAIGDPDADPRTWVLQGGTAEVRGDYDGDFDNGWWTLQSTGIVANPTGGQPITRTLTQTVDIHGLCPACDLGDWSRMVHEDPSDANCLVLEDVIVPIPVRSGGCITMKGTAQITGATTTVDAGTRVTFLDETGSDVESGSSASGWTSSSNANCCNNSYARYDVPRGGYSNYLDVTNFGFAIPNDATVTGIRVEIERDTESSNDIRDADVLLRYNGANVGSNKASASNWGSSETTVAYGGSTDTWAAGLTAAHLNHSTFGVRFRVRNVDTGSSSTRPAYVDLIRVTAYWTRPPQSSIGLPGQNVAEANVVQTCKYGSQAAHTPCSAADHVFSNSYTQTLPEVAMPQVDLDYWYRNAKPGPAHPCNNPGGSFLPGGFDNDYDIEDPRPNDSLQTVWPRYPEAEISPPSSSYNCEFRDAYDRLVGKIAWNHNTRVLEIKGTIFIDGDLRFDNDGQVVHYHGRGIIYAAGDIEFDELVCAGGQYPESCWGNDGDGMSSWDPAENMLTILTQKDAEYDQGATQGMNTPSGLQGLIYSKGECLVHQWFHLSGPILCGEIQIPDELPQWYWPEFYLWPDLTDLVDGQEWQSVGDAEDFEIIPQEVTG